MSASVISRIRPAPRAILLLVFGFVPALLPAVVDVRLWTVWPAFLAAALLVLGFDLIRCPAEHHVSVGVDAPECLYIGDPDPLVVRIALAGHAPRARFTVLPEVSEIIAAPAVRESTVAPGATETLEFALAARRRGEAVVDSLWMRWCGPLGLMRRVARRPVGITVPIVPDVRAVKDAAILASRTDAWSGLRRARHVGEGSEFESLREFQPGLDTRTIDWKASARHHVLLAREFRAERDRPLVVALDTGHLMSDPVEGVPLLDRAINAGLHLAMVGLKVGDRVGLFAFDQEVRTYLEPRAGIGSFPAILKRTAALQYTQAETNFTLGLTDLTSRLKRRSLVVLLTDFVDTVTAELMVENLDRMAKRHLVVMVTLRDPGLDAIADARPAGLPELHRAVVARDLVQEREIVLRRLRRLGIQSIDVPPQAVSSSLIDRYLRIKRREMVG